MHQPCLDRLPPKVLVRVPLLPGLPVFTEDISIDHANMWHIMWHIKHPLIHSAVSTGSGARPVHLPG